MAWYEHPRIFYDWVLYGEDLTPEYAQRVVQKTIDIHADTLAFCVVVGGYSLWNSKVTPKYEHLGDMDLIGEMARLCKEKGLRFAPWWLATATGGVEHVLREHPSWQLVGPSVDGKPGKRQNYICYNSPYRELVYEEVREVLTGYDIDCIYFDQLPISCYCPWCQAKFERLHGRPMPVVADEFFVYNSPAGLPATLKEFRDESVRSFCAGIRRIIDEVNPEVCYAQNWVRNVQSHLAIGYADVLLPEFYQRNDLIPLGLRHRLTKTYFNNGPIWGNVRHAVRHDARHFPLRGTKTLLVDCVANLASPLMLDLCAMDFDATGTEELAENFDHIRSMQEIQVNAEPVKYAALLHSYNSHRLYSDRFENAFEGIYRLLFENHIPFEILNEAAVQRGELEGYKVLIMPDVVSLADKTAEAIRDAVGNGLGLISTYMTGFADDRGSMRNQPALADIFGFGVEDTVAYDTSAGITSDPVLKIPDIDGPMFYYGSARTEHPLAKELPEKGLFSFLGGFIICRPGQDTQVIADIHTIDQVRLSSRPYNRRGHYPGPARWPLAILREHSGSRTAYFALQAEAEYRRAHAPELDTLFLKSVLWAGGQPPLEAPDCPRSVEVRLFHDQERQMFHILLVNLTTNPLINTGGGPAVVRYVTPHKGLRLLLRVDGQVTGVE
ncbi:alpha-amylase family protein, partial [Candidatus Poribacteria bacterium]